MPDISAEVLDDPDLVSRADKLFDERPKWVKGSLGGTDTRFLFQTAFRARASLVVEIGTASGFSTTILCHALKLAYEAGRIRSEYRIISYDALAVFYADETKFVGDAAREQLPTALLEHVIFRHPAKAADLATFHIVNEIDLLFIDANHNHPWPTLDLLAALPYLAPASTVVLHDINLPLVHPLDQGWGAKNLFDGVNCEKYVASDRPIPNIGSLIMPLDRDGFRNDLLRILASHEWQTEIDETYLQRLGPDVVACKP